MTSNLRSVIGQLSPRRRRWLRFLQSLPLDPSALPTPLAELERNDFIICGASRTGTTLLTAALFQPPQVITVMEPWDGMRFPPADLYRSLRMDIQRTGQLRKGRLKISALKRERRTEWCGDGDNPTDIDIDPSFSLGVKWPAYWRFLDYLEATKFLICVREPVEVITSFERVGGRLRMGLDYDTAFNREMNNSLLSATPDPAIRRILLYEYVYSRVVPHVDKDNIMLVHYERWFEDPRGLMTEIGSFLEVKLDDPPVDIQRPRTPAPAPQLTEAIRKLAPSTKELGYVV